MRRLGWFGYLTLLLASCWRSEVFALGRREKLRYRVAVESLEKWMDHPCEDKKWCDIDPPTVSHFSHSSHEVEFDLKKWHAAKVAASEGIPLLIQRIANVIPHRFDIIGHSAVRTLQPIADVYAPHKKLSKYFGGDWESLESEFDEFPLQLSPELIEQQRLQFMELPHAKRGSLMKLAYYEHIPSFAEVNNTAIWADYYLHLNSPTPGPHSRFRPVSTTQFLRMFNQAKPKKSSPRRSFSESSPGVESFKSQAVPGTVYMELQNENWGMVSEKFPNRTSDWRTELTDFERTNLMKFLDDPSTTALFVAQHHNLTHPKVITFPLGIIYSREHFIKLIWAELLASRPKERLIFTASSAWGARPSIFACIHKNANGDPEFDDMATRVHHAIYFRTLASARVSLAPAGLGADTYRLWQLIVLGTLPVIEKSMGLDRTLWKLPALLVEDYAYVTPFILRQAYIEALYRADEWAYERLTESWWRSLLTRLTRSENGTELLIQEFPMQGQNATFRRPMEPFTCENGCGDGTVTTPQLTCEIEWSTRSRK